MTTEMLFKSFSYSGDDYLVGIKNRKGAEGAGTYKHMAGGHQKREKGEMSVWKGFVERRVRVVFEVS